MVRIIPVVAPAGLALGLLAGGVRADPPPRSEPRDATRGGVTGSASPVQSGRESPPWIDLEVGQTVERDVGIAIGLLCDDLSIVHAELRSATPESNVLRVTGARPGDTLCRAGTVPGRPMFVFEIHVTARRPAPP